MGRGHPAHHQAVNPGAGRTVIGQLANQAPGVLKAMVLADRNNAGVYGPVTRVGRLTIGQPVFLNPVLF